MGLGTILLIILAVWLFGASILKVAFWIIAIVAVLILAGAGLSYFREKRVK